MKLFITEKPSVAMEFAKALEVGRSENRHDGYIESSDTIITWCVGHLITLCYPEAYDPELKKWDMKDLPFIPEKYKYEVIPTSKAQYQVVKKMLNRKDVTEIYYSGDSAREGEYIQRLVRQMAGHNPSAKEYRVWIDSQTKEEILRGIKEAKPLEYYNTLSDSAYARAIEDYLIGMNFSRVLSLKYSYIATNALGAKHVAIAVGRVMSCVLGMVVERERLIRNTKVISFYSIKAKTNNIIFDWKINEKSPYFNTPDNYNNNGLLNRAPVTELVATFNNIGTLDIVKSDKSTAKKAAPLLFNLAELQSECTKLYKISPSDTLAIAQSLYEKKLTTYPRTDARVLTTAMTKVYETNISGLRDIPELASFVNTILEKKLHAASRMNNTKYVDDSKVSDHYAIIPTGQEVSSIGNLTDLERKVYMLICKRFLSIFYPEAQIHKISLLGQCNGETFTSSVSMIGNPGYMEIVGYKADPDSQMKFAAATQLSGTVSAEYTEHEGKSKPPSRFTSGSMILAMENAGNLIEDPDLREQIKGSGIGTSATRGEVISKLEKNQYIVIDKKTQIIAPGVLGEIIYDILSQAVPHILNPKYTASWEKGLQGIADGSVTKDVYLGKINNYVSHSVMDMKSNDFSNSIKESISKLKMIYPNVSLKNDKSSLDLKCPKCGSPIAKNGKTYYCTGSKNGCKFSFWGTIAGKELSDALIKDLLASWTPNNNGGGETKISKKIAGFKSSKSNKTFEAKIKFTQATADEYVKSNFIFT